MSTKNIRFLIIAGILSGVSTGLYAQQQEVDEKGWYAGVFGGLSKGDVDDSALPITGSTASALSKDDTTSVLGVAIGYDFSSRWALEGGYTINGKGSARRISTAGTVGSLGADVEGTAFYLAGIGKLRLDNKAYLFGKLGVARTTTEANLSSTGFAIPAGVPINRKRTESNLLWGLGAGYDFTRKIGLRLDYTRTENVGDASTGEGSVNAFTVAVKFRF